MTALLIYIVINTCSIDKLDVATAICFVLFTKCAHHNLSFFSQLKLSVEELIGQRMNKLHFVKVTRWTHK